MVGKEEPKWCIECKEPIEEGEPYMVEPRGEYVVYYHERCKKLIDQTDNMNGKSFFDMDEE